MTSPSVLSDIDAWREAVLRLNHGRCSACASKSSVAVEPIVALQDGGQLTVRNAIVLCRRCAIRRQRPQETKGDRVVSFYVSTSLFARIREPGFLGNFSSRALLLRFLMLDWCDYPSRYVDLSNYQDPHAPGATAKVNTWVPESTLAAFVRCVAERGNPPISDILKGLLLAYEDALLTQQESEP